EELDGDVAGLLRDPVELVDEVHVPRRAAELAVGRRLQPDLLLLPHDLADRLVLDAPQLVVVDAAGGVVLARLQEPLRAKQAAHVVGPERRGRSPCHGWCISQRWPSSRILASSRRGARSSGATPRRSSSCPPASRGSRNGTACTASTAMRPRSTRGCASTRRTRSRRLGPRTSGARPARSACSA